jgi:hypothetical protein
MVVNLYQVSKVVTQCLDQHRKADCKYGRITCSEDFKYLARKVSGNNDGVSLTLLLPVSHFVTFSMHAPIVSSFYLLSPPI